MRSKSNNPVLTLIRSQRLYAYTLFCFGIISLTVFAWSGRNSFNMVTAAVAFVLGFGLMLFSAHQFKEVQRRAYGMRVEGAAVAEAMKVLPAFGLAVSANVSIRGRGDIDLVVGINSGLKHLPVEIKAFHQWEGNSERCKQALDQVNKAQEHLRSPCSYIWLPMAKTGWWRRTRGLKLGKVTVVYGHARDLAKIIVRQTRS